MQHWGRLGNQAASDSKAATLTVRALNNWLRNSFIADSSAATSWSTGPAHRVDQALKLPTEVGEVSLASRAKYGVEFFVSLLRYIARRGEPVS
jgi:hypothetical protein